MPPSSNEPQGEIPLSPRAKGTIEGAPRQAMGLKDDFVGTEHLLLSLLIERDSRTANVLTLLGAPPDLLRTTVFERARAAQGGETADRRPRPRTRRAPLARSPRAAARARPTPAT